MKITKDNVVKIILEDGEIPKYWYNIQADLRTPIHPYLNPATGAPVVPDDLMAIFPKALIEQEVSTERYIEIPETVREMYRSYRMSPLFRARGLEKLIGSKARIYYKYEGGNATGSHKLNTAIPQAYYNKLEGVTKLSTETGAGQWGTALSLACQMFDMECKVFMVKVSYHQKPYRKKLIETLGGTIYASPSMETEFGRSALAKDPETPGSLGMAISEAVEVAAKNDDTNYALGSVLNHVCLHQTIIGQEAKKQLDTIDEYPDYVYACCGGGSNFAGMAFPFVKDKMDGKNVTCVAVEPKSCPTLTKGEFRMDFGDTGMMTPKMEMYTLGYDFVPSPIHAGGLRYHGASPLVSYLKHEGLIEAEAYEQDEVADAARLFIKGEGIIPAPESAHAIKGAIERAKKLTAEGKEEVILICVSGHGYLDLDSYEVMESSPTK
jgi:tryptophan synthase beta chain